MRLIFFLLGIFSLISGSAQENVYPAKENKGIIFIKNATIHVGNGKVIENGTIKINNAKIEQVGADIPVARGDNVTVINAKGKHVYPGLILPVSTLGLVEVSAIRATNDVREIGEMNPSVRTIVAYNADSKVLNTVRSNGVLLANIVPQGNLLAGISSVVQLDAWNWEDAAYKTDGGVHLYMPSLISRPRSGRAASEYGSQKSEPDPLKEDLDKVEQVKAFFREGEAYHAGESHSETNVKFNSVKGLYNKTQKLYVHASTVKQMLVALDFVEEFGFDVVIVGGSESWQIPDLLKQHNVSVILQEPHRLPSTKDEDVDQPYKTASVLQKAGVLFSISDGSMMSRGRNLPFNAGTAAAYGLTKEEALQSITLNAARILGIDDKTGSIEPGKDANIVISEGDILDMRTSIVTDAFIQGRKIDLTDKQKQLYERYNQKYNLKKPF